MTDPDAALMAIETMFRTGKAGDIERFLAAAIVLRPPTYGKSWRGKTLVAKLLGFAAEAFGGLTYTTIWRGEDYHALRFEGVMNGEPISGVDVVRIDETGLISEVEVFARPPRAILQLREAMSLRVSADPEVARLMAMD